MTTIRVPAAVAPISADLGAILPRAARRFGPKQALVAGGRTLSYEDLDRLCDRVAGGLYDIGVRPGDRVSLYSPNRWEWVVAYHAGFRVGAVLNPINVMLTAEEVAFVLNDCGAAAIITSGEKAETILGLTRDVPTLQRVISFDAIGGETTWFGDLLSSLITRPVFHVRPRPTSRPSATRQAQPAIPRERCNRTGRSSSTPPRCSRFRHAPSVT